MLTVTDEKMQAAWMRRCCIVIVDFLFGIFVAIPLSITLTKRALSKAHATEWNECDIPPLDGKVAVVTGAKYVHECKTMFLSHQGLQLILSSAGIGYYTAKQLALRGAKVYLAARSEERVKDAIKRLREEAPSIRAESLAWLQLDLSNQSQVVDAANELCSKEERLDILGTKYNKDILLPG